MTHLLLTVRFLDDRYHGLLARGGPPEWPPSPFRLFQALVAGVARRGELVEGSDICPCDACKESRQRSGRSEVGNPTSTLFTPIGKALGWLQRHTRQHPPIIIAPKSRIGQAITRFVPNNDGDKKLDQQERLTGKHSEPTLFLLEPDQKPEVHYVWDLAGNDDCPLADIDWAARSLTALGWGIDMAIADARIASESDIQQLKGIRWYPKNNAGSFQHTLRIPTYDDNLGECTLCDLLHCHSTFINRVEHGKPLRTVEKPNVFDHVFYSSVETPVGRPCVVFRIECDDEVRRFAYPQRKLIHIAGMVRHVARERMERNPPRNLRGRTAEQWVEQYVAGHRDQSTGPDCPHTQFSYVPLQSIGREHTDPAVRRVMIVAPLGDEEWLEHLARHLDGRLLTPLPNTKLPPGTRLERIADNRKDGVREAYLCSSRTWATVTPVILPGHDDHKPSKTRKLIERALAQSGIEQPCEFEWSAFSQFRKMLGAHKYVRDESARDGKRHINYIRPDHLLDQTAVHLRLTFEHEVPGPLTVGAGRHFGFGLFAAESGK